MSTDLRPGSQVAEYRIERLIGRGGMGVVYLAEHVHLGKRVALKVLPTEYMEDPDFRTRFEREARLAASLEHPNIVPVTDAGEFEGELWIAMRFVDGTDLREVLHEHGALNPIRAVSILGRVASALDAAHVAGLIHRDVKPGNILLEPPSPTRQVEHVYLTDFGLTKQVDAGQGDVAEPVRVGRSTRWSTPTTLRARAAPVPPRPSEHGLTRVGYFAGTVDYAAPEQFRGEQLDGRVDVYALGCVLYECLTGSVPFVGDDEQHVMLMHLEAPVPKASAVRPGIPRGMDAVIARAMAKDREARFPTCREMIDAARSFLAGWDPAAAAAAASMPAAPGPAARLARRDATPSLERSCRVRSRAIRPGRSPAPARARSRVPPPGRPRRPRTRPNRRPPDTRRLRFPSDRTVVLRPAGAARPAVSEPSNPAAPRSFPAPAAPSTQSYRPSRRTWADPAGRS